jgi:hypothetical protein
MNHSTLVAFAATAVTALGLACSPASVGDSGTSADKACADSAYAHCSRLSACSATAVTLRYGDVGTCESTMKSFCLAALAAPSGGSTPGGLESCVSAIPNWNCDDFVLGQNPPPECQQATGSLAAGAGCAFAQQCQSGFCAIVPGAACGTCAAPPQPGDSCAQLTTCGVTLSCLPFNATCVLPGQPMGPCAPTQSCTLGNECIGANYTTGASGTCLAAVESSGAACSSTTNQCDFYAGLTCNTQMKQCVAAQLVGAGQACNFVTSASETMYCGGGGKCLSATLGAQGTCAGAANIGGACDLVAGPVCIGPSRCFVSSGGGTGGTCQVPDGTMCP